MLASSHQKLGTPKPRPRLLDRLEKKRADEQAGKLARAAVRKRDSGRCRACGRAGYEVHHIVARSQSSKLRWNERNLVLLCGSCHRDVTGHVLYIEGRDATKKLTFYRIPVDW